MSKFKIFLALIVICLGSLKVNGEHAYRNALQLDDDDIKLGNLNAKVVVIEYFSLSCPHCANFHSHYFPKIKEQFIDSGQVLYVLREFPVDKKAFFASSLARCSGSQSFTTFTDVLLKLQYQWLSARNYEQAIMNIGKLGGISEEKFYNCLADKKINEKLLRNVKSGSELKFIGIPTFFVNGEKLQNGFSGLEAKIRENITKNS